MIDKSIKRIGIVCLCLASLSLAGCFHIPDEDWLPSRNKIETGDIQKDNQVEQALNSFIDGIDVVSSQRSEMKDDTIETTQDEVIIEESENETIGNENIDGEETENIIIEE